MRFFVIWKDTSLLLTNFDDNLKIIQNWYLTVSEIADYFCLVSIIHAGEHNIAD